MFSGNFWMKYFFRVCHISSLVVLCQGIITAKLTGQVQKGHPLLYMIAGITVILSGFINTFILKPKQMGEKRKLWVGLSHLKLLTAVILFTPIAKLLNFDTQTMINIKFYWMILALIVSPFMRFYRQYYVGKQKERLGNKIKSEQSN